MNTYPEVAMITQELTAMILEAIPEHVDRVILHGSTIDGRFREGESDVDIAVLMNGRPEKFSFMTMHDIEEAINERFKGSWKRIEIVFLQSDNVMKYQNFASCYFGSMISKGIDLYNSGRTISVEPLPFEDAKKVTIDSYINQAWTWVADARMAISYYSGVTSAFHTEKSDWHACRAVSRILQAIILQNDRDDHLQGKSCRWDLQKQFTAVVESHPELIDLKPLIDALPQSVAHKDIEYISDWLGDEHDAAQQRRIIAISLALICKLTNRYFNDKASDARKIYCGLKKVRHHDHFRRTDRD